MIGLEIWPLPLVPENESPLLPITVQVSAFEVLHERVTVLPDRTREEFTVRDPVEGV